MTDEQLLGRIVVDEKVLAGKPVIQGTRLSVKHILDLLAHGMSEAEVLAEYDGLVAEDVQACLLFASRSLDEIDYMPLTAEA